VGSLLSESLRDDFVSSIKNEYAELRDNYKNRQLNTDLLTIDAARQRGFKIDWSDYEPAQPKFIGIQVFEDYDLKELRNYIDWTPFFSTWEIKGRYPSVFESKKWGDAAWKLYEEANKLLDRIIDEKLFTAKAVFGLFPANSVGDDIEVYADQDRTTVAYLLNHLRQQQDKTSGKANACLADFIAPKSSGLSDYIGAFTVTAGHGVDQLAKQFEADHDDYNSIMTKALADRLAEAFAERLHQRIRTEFWGYAADEKLENDDLISESYQGIRPAPGYPACPDHSEKTKLFDMLSTTANIGVELTESYAMTPAASVSGWYFAHPDAFYFGIGKINQSQLDDYAQRKSESKELVKRLLSPSLV
ncbi:MAG: methionine synthase, partial [Calditrichaeota bacterium]|nr:methionine synthase [Calditrichota bacterium]